MLITSNDDKNENNFSSFYYLKKLGIKKLIISADFMRAFICSSFLLSLLAYFSYYQADIANLFLLDVSEVIFSNTIVINSSLLGIIIAAVAIFASFSNPKILSNLYTYKKDEARLHQYLLVLFFPAIPAIIAIFFSFVGLIFLIAGSKFTIIVAYLAVFFTFYCIFGVWESIKQIVNSIVTCAKLEKMSVD